MAKAIQNVVATLDKMPPGKRAWVTADVQVPSLSSSAKLVKRSPQGFNPLILLLDVVVTTPSSPSGAQVATRQVRFDENPALQDYASVEISHAGETANQDFQVVQ
jgi:hypothetical protein